MAGRHIALLRGINVGKAKRVSMEDLRALVADVGYLDVRTLLNSGNVVFTVRPSDRSNAAARIEKAIASRCGFSSRVTVLTAAELAGIVQTNPLRKVATDFSRLLVAVLAASSDRSLLKPLLDQAWSPDALAIGKRAAYLWCANGVLESALAKAANRALGDAITMRNWTTLLKLNALAQES